MDGFFSSYRRGCFDNTGVIESDLLRSGVEILLQSFSAFAGFGTAYFRNTK